MLYFSFIKREKKQLLQTKSIKAHVTYSCFKKVRQIHSLKELGYKTDFLVFL